MGPGTDEGDGDSYTDGDWTVAVESLSSTTARVYAYERGGWEEGSPFVCPHF